jgi:pterin-4a-carbinolamine dehydratase
MIVNRIAKNQKNAPPKTHEKSGTAKTAGWRKAERQKLCKTFRFNTSAHVLAFALKTRQMAHEAGITAKVEESFGKAQVMLYPNGSPPGRCAEFAALLNRTAAAIGARPTSPLRTTFL